VIPHPPEDPCQSARQSRACRCECQRRDYCPLEDERLESVHFLDDLEDEPMFEKWEVNNG